MQHVQCLITIIKWQIINETYVLDGWVGRVFLIVVLCAG